MFFNRTCNSQSKDQQLGWAINNAFVEANSTFNTACRSLSLRISKDIFFASQTSCMIKGEKNASGCSKTNKKHMNQWKRTGSLFKLCKESGTIATS